MGELQKLVLDLVSPDTRENALLELSKKREAFPDLAPILWHSFGTVAALLQEIISIYPLLSPPALTAHASNRVCNALALLQCVASHTETRALFLSAHVPLFLYPFLNTGSKTRPFEYLRLTSLGVIGALVKVCSTAAKELQRRVVVVAKTQVRATQLSLVSKCFFHAHCFLFSGCLPCWLGDAIHTRETLGVVNCCVLRQC